MLVEEIIIPGKALLVKKRKKKLLPVQKNRSFYYICKKNFCINMPIKKGETLYSKFNGGNQTKVDALKNQM